MAAQMVACHTLWLRHWEVGSQLNINLATVPFVGSQLFREETLKDILTESRDKMKALVTQKLDRKRTR